MRMLTFAAVCGVLLASGLNAAPVPKQKEKTTEEKLIGKWKLVKSDANNGAAIEFEFVIDYKAKGEMSFLRKFEDGSTSSSPGQYKVEGTDKIEWTINENGNKRGETSKIKVLDDKKMVLEDPDGIKEEFERVIEKPKEPKKEPKKD